MKKMFRSTLASLLIIVILLTSYLPTVAATGQPTKYSSEYNSGERGVVCTTLSGTSAASYYASYSYDTLSEQSSSQLFSTLQTLMRTTHKTTSSYNDCHYKADRTDCENEDGRVSLIYTAYSATMSQWNGWNREHVWPQSLGGGNTSGGGADLHHVRPSDASVNSSRGNKKYGNTNGGTAKYGSTPATGYLGGYYNSSYFEPVDSVKGDVARICLYVYVRWGSEWGADSITEVFQSIDVLLEWCALDPVDTWEMGRNEVVQDIQGNRNVFIDYPELAWLLFDREIPSDMVTPSGIAMDGNTSSGGNSGGSTDGGDTDTACKHTSTEIKNAVTATCTTSGYSGDTYCKSCGDKVSSGTTILAKGHIWGTWQINSAQNTKTRTCLTCNYSETKPVSETVCSHTSLEFRGEIAATCTSKGYTGDAYCVSCNEMIFSGSYTPEKEHSWSNMVVSVAPTQQKDGLGVYTCTVCSTTKQVVLEFGDVETEVPGLDYGSVEEQIIAIITKNIFDCLIADYLTKA